MRRAVHAPLLAGTGAAQPKAAPPETGSSGGSGAAQAGIPNPEPWSVPRHPPGPEDLESAPGSGETSGSGQAGRVGSEARPDDVSNVRSQFRNVLFGRVKARDTNEPEEGVRVTISSRTKAFEDRVALTDAFGRFAVKVPDGDWIVNVTMPSGRVYSVSEITVSNGLITDDDRPRHPQPGHHALRLVRGRAERLPPNLRPAPPARRPLFLSWSGTIGPAWPAITPEEETMEEMEKKSRKSGSARSPTRSRPPWS